MLTKYNIYDNYSELIIKSVLEKLITIIYRYGFIPLSNTYNAIVNEPLIINYVNINSNNKSANSSLIVWYYFY